jgi:methanogenic corrinoid protein MtbC1
VGIRSWFVTNHDPLLAETRLAIAATVVAGDSGGLYHLVADLLDKGVPMETVLFDLLVPVEKEIGRRWQQGDVLISEEHAATATVETVVSLLAGSFDQPKEGSHVVIAAAEGDDHSLVGRMLAAHLLFLGLRTTFLGANVLAEDLREYLQGESPDVLCVSCAQSNRLLGARAVIRAAHDSGVPVIVGGNGFGAEGIWANALGADQWVASPRDVPQVLESWRPDVRSSEALARDPEGSLEALTRHRPAIISAACSFLAARTGDAPDSRATTELQELLRAVEASLLVDDPDLLVEMISWQRSTMRTHGRTDADHVADALREALGDFDEDTAAALDAATHATG